MAEEALREIGTHCTEYTPFTCTPRVLVVQRLPSKPREGRIVIDKSNNYCNIFNAGYLERPCVVEHIKFQSSELKLNASPLPSQVYPQNAQICKSYVPAISGPGPFYRRRKVERFPPSHSSLLCFPPHCVYNEPIRPFVR
jgi:hypothetical protein